MTSEQNVQSVPSLPAASPAVPPADATPSAEAAEITRLKAESERLSRQVQELEKDRDAYLRAVYALEKEKITDEDLQRWVQEHLAGEGVPLEAFIGELEQIVRGR